MIDNNRLIWLVLGVIFVGAAFWHILENRRLARKWRGDLDAASAERLVRFAWGRTAQLLYAIACTIAVILVYDWQLGKSQQEVVELQNKATEVKQAEIFQAPPKKRGGRKTATRAAASTKADSTRTA